MTQEQYNSMIGMLIAATYDKKIIWEENNDSFSTHVSGCGILLSSSYDYNINLCSFSLQLSNKDGVAFETFTYSEDVNPDEYNKLNSLYSCIRDVNYRISESEKCILDALKELTKPDDDLPF